MVVSFAVSLSSRQRSWSRDHSRPFFVVSVMVLDHPVMVLVLNYPVLVLILIQLVLVLSRGSGLGFGLVETKIKIDKNMINICNLCALRSYFLYS